MLHQQPQQLAGAVAAGAENGRMNGFVHARTSLRPAEPIGDEIAQRGAVRAGVDRRQPKLLLDEPRADEVVGRRAADDVDREPEPLGPSPAWPPTPPRGRWRT